MCGYKRYKGSDLWGKCNSTREVCNSHLWAPLTEVDIAQIGVSAGAIRLLLQHDLEKALCIIPPALCCCPHPCVGSNAKVRLCQTLPNQRNAMLATARDTEMKLAG